MNLILEILGCVINNFSDFLGETVVHPLCRCNAMEQYIRHFDLQSSVILPTRTDLSNYNDRIM